tara:strand:+ start:370 stop:663 length:294 start_codon:yes stop_codon:yes gene_type:complete
MKDIFKETKILMQSTNTKNIQHICDEIKVSTRWFYGVKKGEIKEPSVIKIMAIYDLLSDQNKNSLPIYKQGDLFSNSFQQQKIERIVLDWDKTKNKK